MEKKREEKLKQNNMSYTRANKSIFIVQVSNSLKLLYKYLVYNYSSENLLKTILYYLLIDKS